MERKDSVAEKKSASAFKYISLAAFSLSLVECIGGILCCVLYLVYHNCGIKVYNETENDLQDLALVFYTSYIAGDCTYADQGDTEVDVYNPNSLTKPDNIVIWQIIYLVLYILWAFSAALLPKSFKRPTHFVTPWLVLTGCMLVADVIFTVLALTDLGKKDDISLPQPSYKDHYTMKTLLLVLYCCKLGIFWLCNLVFFSWILIDLIHERKTSGQSASLWTDKKFDDIRSELSSQGDTEDREEEHHIRPDIHQQPEMTTEFRGEPQNPMSNGVAGAQPNRYPDHQPARSPDKPPEQAAPAQSYDNRGYQPDDEGDELRKPKSFKDRVKETKENKMNVGSGGMYSYTAEPPVVPNYKKHVPTQDVDNAFGFLSNYDDRPRSDGPKTSRVMNGRRVYDRDEDDPFYIPKV